MRKERTGQKSNINNSRIPMGLFSKTKQKQKTATAAAAAAAATRNNNKNFIQITKTEEKRMQKPAIKYQRVT